MTKKFTIELTEDELMKTYCLGFVFDEYLENILLIEKKTPEWQAGLYNGIGGKVEDNEFPIEAMIRECKEETGLDIPIWIPMGSMAAFDWEVSLFTVQHLSIHEAETKEEEEVKIIKVSDIGGIPTISNIPWLVLLAKNFLEHPSNLERVDIRYL